MYGDVHAAQRAALGVFFYRHYGVEVADGEICEYTLAHGIHLVSYDDFARGCPTWTAPGGTPEERTEIVQRALSRVGERYYSLLGNNCEHFANWCATGVAISYQVLEFFQGLIRLALGIIAGALLFSLATAE